MKRPLYYLLCAIACTSMVGATMPMAAVAEAIQPQAAAVQQAQADATSSDAGKAEDGANTNATADTAEDSTATSTGTSAANTESADGTTAATTTPTPSLRAQTNPTPAAISATAQTTYAHSATATQNGVTFTVSWNDAPAGTATTFHVTQTNGSSKAKARMDVPTYWDGGSQESVCDPSRPAWASYCSLGTAGHDFTFDFTASGTYRIYFYFMDNDRNDPQNDKGIYYLRTTAEVTVNDAARLSVTQIVNNAVDLCRQETNGSEYDMALWLHDWTLDQLEYDHSLNWCSAESGLTRHQGTCESYQRIYSKLLDAAGIANGRITGNGHTWNAVKIDGKWCQMDLTWDDTSDNWYGDLDQRHLYFGLTDELMAIAHSDHTANYQKNRYAYRSTDLSNNYFVRNGKADEWAEKYADRVQQHLDAKEESFSIDADNQLFPPSISGIQNGVVAYAMNQRRWKVQGAKVELAATSNVATLPNSTLTVKYDCTAKYQAAQVKPVQSVPDGEYMICNRGLGTAMLDISGASRSNGANAQLWEANGSGAQRFMISYDECAGAYEIMCAASGLALDVDCADFSSGANVQQYARNGSAAQRWLITQRGDGAYTIASAGGPGLVLDAKWGSTSNGTNVQLYESNGSAAQSWRLAATGTQSVPDGEYMICNRGLGTAMLDISGASRSNGANAQLWEANGSGAQRFMISYDECAGAYEIMCAASGLALDVDCADFSSGANVQQYARNGSAAQRWLITQRGDGAYTIASAGGPGLVLDAKWGSTSNGTNVQLYESNGSAAQSWRLAATGRNPLSDRRGEDTKD